MGGLARELGQMPGQGSAAAIRAFSTDTRFRVSPDVVAQRVGQGTVVVHLCTNRIYDLNPTGSRLWDLLGAGHDSPAMLHAQMLEEFDVAPAELAAEIERLLTSLTEAGLVTPEA